MGLSASQARLLSLTARKSDLEHRGQTTNERRRMLSTQTEKAAQDYADALSNKRIVLSIDGASDNTIYFDKNIVLADVNQGGLGMIFVDSDGNEINVNGELDDDGNVITPGLTSAQLERRLQAGTIHLRARGSDSNFEWRADTSGTFTEELDDSDDELATALYDSRMATIQSQDKSLELDLKQIDTQQETVQTELDAVKKVIDKNIAETFKTFG